MDAQHGNGVKRMIIDSKMELLMVLIGLENAPELILDDERSQEWHKRTYVSLFNRVAEEYNEMVDNEEKSISLFFDSDRIV
jgi:hypothetical protein